MTFNEIGHVVCGDCEGTGNDLDGYRKGQYCYTCNGRGSSLPHTADVILLLLDIHKMLKDDRAVAWNTSGEPTEWGILCNLEAPASTDTFEPTADGTLYVAEPWWSRLFNWRSK